MGFNDFWNTSQRANDFLRTGNINDTVRNAGSNTGSWSPNVGGGGNNNPLDTGSGCTGSSQCPSGWACVDGVCKQMGGGGNQQQPSPGGGDCDPDDPESPCNSGGPGACQQTPGCGDDSEARDCCGTRCCSFGSASSSRPGVHCFCGECPPWPGCSSFCDSYLKANGEPGPGCQEGRGGNSCDACTECDGNVGGECKPLFIGAPCWCEGEECNGGACQKCGTDPNSDNYGECELDKEGCQECATIANHICPCNRILPAITVCTPYGSPVPPIEKAKQEAARRCAELCENEPDPCAVGAPRRVKRCCFADYGDCTFPSCSSPGTEGSTEVASTVDANGYGCVTCEYPLELPEECKDCDCNCNNDCGNCEVCGTTGTCEPDPACNDIEDGVLIGTYPDGGQEGLAGSCQTQVYVTAFTSNEQGPCCPDADNGSCACPGRTQGDGCNPYYACLPQEPAQEGDVVQVWAAFAPQPCYVYTNGAWWSSGRDCAGCPCNDKPSQLYEFEAELSDGSFRELIYSRPVGYKIELISCAELSES